MYEANAEIMDDMEKFMTGKLRYREFKTMNMEKIHDPNNTFVLPIFLKPGRTHFMLRTPADKRRQDRASSGASMKLMHYQKQKDAFFRFYYNRHIIPLREEKVPGCKCSRFA